jgi:MoaA/NifB/PqqE/SkfB family radical SAM enzyme
MGARTAARAARAVALNQLTRRPLLLVASLMVTRRCNLRCDYCARNRYRNPELTTDQWRSLMDEMAQLGCLQVSLTGGEPLLRKDIAELMRHARGLGFKVKLNTNGLLVPRHQDAVALADSVTLRLDGPEGPHDLSRGQGSYRKVMSAARTLRGMGKPTRFYTVLSSANLAHLGELLDDAQSLDCTVFFQPGTATALGEDATPNPLAPSAEDYRAALDQLIAWKRAGRPIGNSVSALGYLRNWPDDVPQRCAWGLFCRIEEDGNLRTCGRDTQTERVDVAALGLREALRRRPQPECASCWTAARVELHLIAQGEPSALLNYARGG